MRSFNLVGTLIKDGNHFAIEAEGNKYFISAWNVHRRNLSLGQEIKFCAIVPDSASGDLSVCETGHLPDEYRNIDSYGAGDDAGLAEGEVSLTFKGGKRIVLNPS